MYAKNLTADFTDWNLHLGFIVLDHLLNYPRLTTRMGLPSFVHRLSKLAEAEEQMRRQARSLAARQEEVQQKEALLDKQQKLLVSLRKELARQEAAAAKAVQELEARSSHLVTLFMDS